MASTVSLLSKFVHFIVVIFIFIHFAAAEDFDIDDGEQTQLFEHNKHYSYDHFDSGDLSKASTIASTSLSCFLSATTDFIADVQTNGFNPRFVAAITIILLCGYVILGILLSVKKTRYTSKQIQKPKRFNALIATAVALINQRRELFASKDNAYNKSADAIPLPPFTSFKSKKNKHQQHHQNDHKRNDSMSNSQQKQKRYNSISQSSKQADVLLPYPVVKKVNNDTNLNGNDFPIKTRRDRASRAGIVTMTRTSSPSPSTMSTSPSSMLASIPSPVENETVLARNQLINKNHKDVDDNDLRNVQNGIMKENNDIMSRSLSEFSSAVMEHALENKYDSITPIFYDYFSEPIASVSNNSVEENSPKSCNSELGVPAIANLQNDCGTSVTSGYNNNNIESNLFQPIQNAKDTEFNACSSVLRSLSLFEDEETFEFDA